MHALPLIMLLTFGAPSFSAMTPLLWAQFAVGQVGNVKTAIKVARDLNVIMHSPAFRVMAAANGEAAIRWQQQQMEF